MNDGLRAAAERLASRLRSRATASGARPPEASLDWVADALDEIVRAADDADDEMRALRRDLALLRSEYARYLDLFNWAPIAYLTTDERGVIAEANLSAGFLLGAKSADLAGRSFVDLLAEGDRLRFHEAASRARRQPSPVVWEARIQPVVGDLFVGEVATVSREGSGRGHATLRLGIRDVTARHREAADAQRALDQAEAAERTRQAFMIAVAHDLRAPVNGILAAARLLDRAPLADDERVGRGVGAVIANAEALRQLQNQVLDLERFARGGAHPHPRDVRLDQEIEAVVKAVPLGDRSVELDLDAVDVRVDPGFVATIVRNLLQNAARHTPPLTRVWVRASARDDGVLLVVEDDGPGIAPGDRERVFELFTSLDDAGDRSGGMGAGLHIVRRFAELHGGRAWVESRDGGGASFRVVLREDARS